MKMMEMSARHIDVEVEKAVSALKRGQVILYPSDTLWALTCDIYNKAAVERIKKIKKSDVKGEMILTVSSIEMLKEYVISIHPRIETLLVYHQKPLSIIYDTPYDIPDYLLSPDGSIAIRVVNDELSQTLIDRIKQPLLSTTASIEKPQMYPSSFQEVSTYIIEEVDHTIDLHPPGMIGLPSILAKYNRKGDLEFVRT